jgi:cytochrome c biogenesis protein
MNIRYFFVRYLANLQFAIRLLLTIAGLSTIGSVIEQNEAIDFYHKNYAPELGNFFNDQIILQYGLDHLYQTWWFISLLAIFGTSLISCTFLQQLPILKLARQFRFYNSEKKFAGLTFSAKVSLLSNGSLINILEKSKYQNFQKFKSLYSNKGIIGRISPIIVHISMVTILSGSLLASVTSFVAQEVIPETEIFHIQNLLNRNVNNFVPKIASRVNDFWILYKEDRSLGQFYTDLSILNSNGEELKRETIYINHPLKYNGLTFYQTDWDVLGIRVQFERGLPYQIPILKPTKKVWLAWIPIPPKPNQLRLGYTLFNTTIRGDSSIYNQAGELEIKGEIHETFSTSKKIQICEFINATGIQIKADPGLALIYSGFFFLLISILTSYISYSQIWLSQINNQVILGGLTNRAKIEFEFEILNIGLQFQRVERSDQ